MVKYRSISSGLLWRGVLEFLDGFDGENASKLQGTKLVERKFSVVGFMMSESRTALTDFSI